MIMCILFTCFKINRCNEFKSQIRNADNKTYQIHNKILLREYIKDIAFRKDEENEQIIIEGGNFIYHNKPELFRLMEKNDIFLYSLSNVCESEISMVCRVQDAIFYAYIDFLYTLEYYSHLIETKKDFLLFFKGARDFFESHSKNKRGFANFAFSYFKALHSYIEKLDIMEPKEDRMWRRWVRVRPLDYLICKVLELIKNPVSRQLLALHKTPSVSSR